MYLLHLYNKFKRELEKVATNYALPLKAAQSNAIGNLKSLWGLRTPTTVLARFPTCHQTRVGLRKI